jgi:hypothetical protein
MLIPYSLDFGQNISTTASHDNEFILWSQNISEVDSTQAAINSDILESPNLHLRRE